MNRRLTIKKIAVVFSVGLLISACGKSFLEKENIGKISKELMFKDMEGIRAGLVGAYNRVANYAVQEFGVYGDIAGDHVKQRADNTELFMKPQYDFTSQQEQEAGAVGHIWLNILEALDNTNNVLDAIPTLKGQFPLSETELESINGQALILRALCHFDLSKAYAQTYTYSTDASHLGVPLLKSTPGPGENVSRKTMKETYAMIIEDLKEGERLLRKVNSAKDQFATSYQAAWGLLSRVYLYMGDWQKSVDYADSLIQKGGFVLTPAADYSAMFRSEMPGKEVVFQLYSRRYSSSTVGFVFTEQTAAANKLIDLYDTDDTRLDMFKDSIGLKFSMKYVRGASSTSRPPMDPKVVRLSEAYLNRAEALWQLNKYNLAIADVELIANRSHPVSPVVAPTDPAQLYQFICDERSRELCFEGHRLFDITRRKQKLERGADCNSETCLLNFPDNRFVLPIPQKELDANRAMQPNPGVNR